MSNANEFARLWFKFNQAYEAYLEANLAPTLTASHLVVLEFLDQNVHSKPSDLIDFLKTTPAAVTTLLDRMQKSGLIHRNRDAEDKRIVRLTISAFGLQEMERGRAVRTTFMQNQLNGLSTHNQQMLVYLFGKISKFE